MEHNTTTGFEWIAQNKEWLFSGAGVAIILFIISNFTGKGKKSKQTIKSGNNSTNTQIGGDYNRMDNSKRNQDAE